MQGQIQVPYPGLQSVARGCQTCATELQAVLQALDGRTAQLLAGWDGVAEESFMAELASCRQRLAAAPVFLTQLGQALSHAAAHLEQEEQAAGQSIVQTVTADD